MRKLPLLLLLPLCACGREEPPPPSAPEKQEKPTAPAAAPPPPAQSAVKADEGESPADVLDRYYRLIEAGRYGEAWAMRSASKAGSAEFARNFAAYEKYEVTVGTASEPVEAGGWTFVEVPIQIFGRLEGGEPFGSAGSVTMRRASDVPGATARERSWHIYTRD